MNKYLITVHSSDYTMSKIIKTTSPVLALLDFWDTKEYEDFFVKYGMPVYVQIHDYSIYEA